MRAVDVDAGHQRRKRGARQFSGKPDFVLIAAFAAADGQQRGDAVVEGLFAVFAVIDANRVVAAETASRITAADGGIHLVAMHGGGAGNRIDVDGIAAPIRIDGIDRRAGAIDEQGVCALPQRQVEVLDAGVVDADMDGTELLDRLVDGILHRHFIGHIHFQENNAVTQLFGQRLSGIFVEIENGHFGPRRNEFFHGGAPQT